MAQHNGFFMNLINFIIVLLAIIATFCAISWVYLKLTDGFPKTTATAYVSSITDQYGKEQPVMSAQYFAGDSVGEELFELRMTYYTGINKQTVKSYGIQYFDGKYYYYDTYQGTSWSTVAEYDENNPMIIEIDDKTYGIALEGTYKKATFNFFKAVWFGVGGLFTGWTDSYNRTHDFEEINYTYEDFFSAMKQHVIYNNSKANTYDLPLVELSEYFTLYEEQDGQLVKTESTTFDMNYFSVACTTYSNGIVYAEQSMFGMVGNDSSYNTSGIDRKDFWDYKIEYKLTNADFLTRSLDNGDVVLYVDPILLRELQNSQNCVVSVEVELTKSNKIVGLDYYALQNVAVKSFNVSANFTDATFSLYDYSLSGTGLTRVTADNVQIITSDLAFAEVEK